MHSAPESEFARILTGIEERTGLSHQRIADAAGVDRSQVWRWVSAGSNPGYEPVRRLAAWLIAERPEVASEAALLLPAAGYETPPVAAPPRRPRRLKALEDSDEPGLQPYIQAVLRQVYTAAGIISAFPPGADLPGLERLPELEPVLEQMPAETVFPGSAADATLWDQPLLGAAERVRLVAKVHRMAAGYGNAGERRVSGLAPWRGRGAVRAGRYQAGIR